MKYFFSITIILIALFIAHNANAGIIFKPVFNTGLVGYWDFQEGAGSYAYDKSGYDNDGTWNGTAWLIDESFEGAGYENSWNEYEDVESGCIVDEDNTDITPPTGGDSQVLKIHGEGNGNNAFIIHNFGGDQPDTWTTFYYQVESVANAGWAAVMAEDSNWTTTWRMTIDESGGSYYISTDFYYNGGIQDAGSYEISLDTWYKISVKYDITGAAYEWKVNDVSQESGSLTGTLTNGVRYFRFYGIGWTADFEVTQYFDLLKMSTTGYDDNSHWTDGQIGKGGIFNGSDDYVDTNSEMDIDGMTELSVCNWIKFVPGSVDTDHIMLNKWGTADVGMSMWIDNIAAYSGRTNTISFTVHSNSAGARVEGSNNLVTSGQWDHYCGVFKGDTFVRLYKNGVLDQENTNSIDSVVEASTANVRIGRSSVAGNDRYFDGKIDEVRIYNRALSTSEVQRLYKLSQPKMLAPTNTGLVGYWSFEEGTGTKVGDFSGNGNNGTMQNMEESDWVDGKFGKAVKINIGSNDEYIDFGDPAELQLGNTGTVAAWLKYSTQSSHAGIISKSDWCNDRNGYTLGTASATQKAHGQIADGSGYNAIQSTQTLNDNTWHHVVFTWDGSFLRIYVDGVSDNTPVVQTLTPVSNVHDLYIGQISGCGGYLYDGSIDEVRIYNRALEPNEITVLYNSGLAKINSSQNDQLTNGLVSLWSLNGPDMDGNEAYDRSGNGNTGTIIGATPTIGKIGQALDFNGSSDYVTTNKDFNELFSVSEHSISVWVYPTDNSSTTAVNSGYLAAIIMDEKSDLWITNGSNSGQDRIWIGIYDGSAKEIGINYSLNQWVHIVQVHKDGVLYAYKNGVLIDSVAAGNVSPDYCPMVMGRNTFSGVNEYFDGKIDEVRIYNRALTAQEVKRLYNLGR